MDALEPAIYRGSDVCRSHQMLIAAQGPFFAFAAIVAGVAAWSIWGQDIFPSSDPTGGMFSLRPLQD